MTAEETLRRLTDAGLVASGSYGPVFDPTAIVALLDRLTALETAARALDLRPDRAVTDGNAIASLRAALTDPEPRT